MLRLSWKKLPTDQLILRGGGDDPSLAPHPTAPHTMKFAISIIESSRRFDDPIEMIVNAHDEKHARIIALRRYFGNRKICTFIPYNPLPGQEPSNQAGYGYETAPAKSGAELAAATPLLRVTMTRL